MIISGKRFSSGRRRTRGGRAALSPGRTSKPLDEGSRAHEFFTWLQAQLPSLQMPALVLWGREDAVFPPSYADRFVQTLPHAWGPVLVTGRHFLQEDSGREIGERIAGFLAEVEGQQA